LSKPQGLSDILTSIIQNQRVRELDLNQSFRWMIIWLNVFASIPSIWSPMLTFIAYAVKAKIQNEGSLSMVQAFTSLAIITLVTKPASTLLIAIPMVVSAGACFSRMQAYLLSESMEDRRLSIGSSPSSRTAPATPDSEDDIELVEYSNHNAMSENDAIVIANATIRPSLKAPPALDDVNLSVKKASISIIVGPAGSGKTTLMRAMLGELPCDSGSVAVSSKSIAYCGQTPWLLNVSIQENICGISFDGSIDELWYSKVLYACALDHDMLQLPEGDRSIIGSKGLTLSGGQKQRLVYHSNTKRSNP
jgi:ATP-binding cassette subfamily C (CFTR/MRP) protein 1